MAELKRNKKLIVVCIILVLIVSSIVLLKNKDIIANNKLHSVGDYITKYEANEYLPVMINNEDIVKIYLNNYKNNILTDISAAYNLLNKEYREKKFGNIDKFKEYIKNFISLSTYTMEVDKYSISSVGGDKLFNIYDKSGNQYIIREKSIMDYEVYLDEYTVSIK